MTNQFPIDPAQIGAQCLCLHARRAARVLARRYDEALASVDLTNGQFTLMAMLAGNRVIGMQALADSMGMDRTTLTAAIKPLVRRELLSAQADPLDARARRLRLTRAGAALLRKAIPLWQQIQQTTIDRVGHSDAARLREDLQQIL
jgi:DNA-binding MarR family transcriptional regulator